MTERACASPSDRRRIFWLGTLFGGVALGVLSSSPCWAQLAPGGIRVRVAQSAPQPDAEQPTDEMFSHPLARPLESKLYDARKLLKDNRYSEALPRIQEVIESPQDYFAKREEGQPVRRGLKAEAQELIGQQNGEGLRTYQSLYGAKAQALLDEAVKKGDIPAVAAVTRRFFHTKAGYEAQVLLSRYQLDHNEPLAAAIGLERVRASAGGAAMEPALSVLTAACWVRSGRPEKASETLLKLKAGYPTAQARIAGKDVGLTYSTAPEALDWLKTNLGEQPPEANPEAVNWAVYRGNAARNASTAGGLPLLAKRWHYPGSTRLEELNNATSGGAPVDGINRGVTSLPVFQPLAIGNTVVVRGPKTLDGVRFDTGTKFWHPSGADQAQASDDSKSATVNPNVNPVFAEGNQLIDNPSESATYGGLASDGENVYVVEESPDAPATPRVPRFGIRPGMGNVAFDSPTNTLCAFKLSRQGAREWKVGGSETYYEPQLAGAFFLGAPLPIAGRLYVLAEVQGEIRLVVIDPKSGKLDWSQQLADVKNVNDYFGNARRLSGVSPSYADGVLICPSSAGAVVAVDLANRSLLWGVEYRKGQPPNQMTMVQQRMKFGGMITTMALKADRWYDSTATLADGCVLLTPIDTEQLYCYSLIDGKLLWQFERGGEYLYVAGVSDGKVLLIGRRQAQTLKLADGKPAWDHPLVLSSGVTPSGRGFMSGKNYFLPLSSAEVAQIDLQAGQIVAKARSRAGIVPGNLICFKGDVISQGAGPGDTSIVYAFHQLKPLEASIAQRLADGKEVDEALADRGEIELDQGRLTEAIADLRKSLGLARELDEHRPLEKQGAVIRPQQLLFEALLGQLSADFNKSRETVGEIESLAVIDSQRLQFYRVLADGLHKSGDHLKALDVYLKLVDFHATAGDTERVSADLSVRRDRWLQARLNDLYSACAGDERAKFDDEVRRRRELALAVSKDDASGKAENAADKLRKFLGLFSWHPLADEARFQLFAQLNDPELSASGERPLLLERESLLSELMNSADAASRRQATAQMAMLLKDGNHLEVPEDAAVYYRKLRDEFANDVCYAGKTGKQLAAELGADSAIAQALAPNSGFPLGKVKRDPGGPRRQANMPPPTALDWVGARPEVFASTSVVFDQQQQTIVGKDGMGKDKFRISLHEGNQNRFYNYQPINIQQSSISAEGHLLLVNFGNQLLAMDSLRSPGGATRVVWQQDISDVGPGMFNGVGPSTATIQLPGGLTRTIVTSGPNGQPLDSLALVTEKCICLRRARDLIALEPLTGKVLWIRHNLPANAEIFGDEEAIVVVPLESSIAAMGGGPDATATVTTAAGRVITTRYERKISVASGKPSKDETTAILLRPIDGEQIARAPITPAARRWAYFGHKYVAVDWTDDKHSKITVTLCDPVKGESRPLGQFASGFRAAKVAEEAVAFFDPSGHCILTTLADGPTIIDQQLEPENDAPSKTTGILGGSADSPAPSGALQEIVVHKGAGQYVLLVNHAVQRTTPNQNFDPTSLELPIPRANGRVYAFDAKTGQKDWSAPALVHRYFALFNQGVDLPVLVFLRPAKQQAATPNRPAEMKASILCLDRRTGRAVLEEDLTVGPNPYNPNGLQCDISGDRSHRTVALAMPNQTLTLTFSEDPIPPEPPYQAGLTGRPFRLGSPSATDYLRATGRGPGGGGAFRPMESDEDDDGADPFGAK